MRPRILSHAFVLLAFVLLVAGCGTGDSRSYHVKGTVTYKDNPVPAGDIQFVPDGNGAPGFAKIVNGKYDTSEAGNKGTVGGKHTVIIHGFDGKANPDAELPMGNQLFQEFKTTVEIPSQLDPVTKDFKVVEQTD